MTRTIAAPPAEVWSVISAPGNLTDCHPFCAANLVAEWPGAGSRDTVEYHNGRVVERRFTAWYDQEGYDLDVFDPSGLVAQVSWRIARREHGSALTIALTPCMAIGRIPMGAARIMLRRYLAAVARGVDFRVTTGAPVRRNQFGAHPWFSPMTRDRPDPGGTTMTEARRGFFPVVHGEQVTVRQAGAVVCAARGDLSVTQGGGSTMLAGGNLTISEGGGNLLACGGDITITNGGGLVAAASRVDLRNGYVGVALAGSVSVGDGGRVLLGTREAVALGLAAGLACAVLGRLLRR